jgi:hypothetical protein
MTDLNDVQKYRIERLARERGERCQQCGSTTLWCGDERPRQQIGNVTVDLHCDNHPADAFQPFRLSNEEAQEIGLIT